VDHVGRTGAGMKMMGKRTALWVVLGLCLPSYSEILVYKATDTGPGIEQQNGEWRG
jgi:hypothetical protein